MIILGIETSCDETAAAVVTDKREILSNTVLSQLEEHAVFGGVVPEIAARAHLDHLDNIIATALKGANVSYKDLSGVAATCGPGLIGGLLVGALSAKTIAGTLNIPFLAINHLEGHALTPRLTDNLAFPYLLLLVSGGHTQILVVEGVGQYKRWGTTLDDAAGECFDKSAKLLGLPFPGGPNVEKFAKNCRNPIAAREKFKLPSPMKGRKNCDFSFSGLKTAVRNTVDKNMTEEDKIDLAFAFQEIMADVLSDRCAHAMRLFLENYTTPTPTLVVAGGVSANQTIRARLEQTASKFNMRLYAPPLSLCGDNAAMIAWAGLEHLRLGHADPLNFKARPRWPLDPTAQAKPGAGVKA
jgi:N6-L-threonylcarbamoyladenine synthase